MSLNGKLVSHTSIKSDGDRLFDLFSYKLSDIANICPEKIQSVDLVAGQWGAVGSVVLWTFTLGGEKKKSKEVIEAVDEEKKSIRFRVVEGDLLEAYNSFEFSLIIDSNGENKTATWTLEYEKKSETVPDPHALMDICVAITKDIELWYSLAPN
ncbi:Kirola [Sesamum alatum]|uniref:Kirola n=1 Tax=Sesamum alatum TaxID=300844 RepID=A0AAE1Y4R7_9LAMI|nr:Kirola [Sesamum alatum]